MKIRVEQDFLNFKKNNLYADVFNWLINNDCQRLHYYEDDFVPKIEQITSKDPHKLLHDKVFYTIMKEETEGSDEFLYFKGRQTQDWREHVL